VSLRIAALGLLAQHPGSGYDLLRLFQKSMANVWPATQSQLYGELNKLADTGLIEVADVGPRGRKVYRITAAGQAELRRWITDTRDDPPVRLPGLLRVFLLGEVGRDQARQYLSDMAAHADAEVARYEALRDSTDWDADDGVFFARMALEYGLRRSATEAEWARWVLAEIDARAGDGRQRRRKSVTKKV
jgi:DNA-binding PadR family transcriptional regulator